MPLGPNGSGGGSGGALTKVYDSTLAVDATSIDTGQTIPGTGAVLEVYVFARTDEATTSSSCYVYFNNDATAIYDNQRVSGANATAAAVSTVAANGNPNSIPGASNAANVFGGIYLNIPAYAATNGFKDGVMVSGFADTTAANSIAGLRTINYRSTSAITRVAVTPITGGVKLKAGSRLVVYIR